MFNDKFMPTFGKWKMIIYLQEGGNVLGTFHDMIPLMIYRGTKSNATYSKECV